MNNPFDTTNPWSNQTRGTGFNNQYNDPYRQTQVYTGSIIFRDHSPIFRVVS